MTEENVIMKGGQQFPMPGTSVPKSDLGPTKTAKEYMSTRRGMGVGIITRGTVPIKWSMHLNEVSKCFPGGMFWKYLIVERMSWAAARNEIVRKCRANNFEWLLFIDDDVFVPKDAVAKMMASGKKIITGIYWTKTENPAPVIFKEMGKGPIYDFEPDKIIPIGGSGLGCCLIHLEVFDKFDEAGIPYFVENWVYVDPMGSKLKCPIGEDHYFFIKAKEMGYESFAHTGVLCDHYDSKKDKFYPGEDIVSNFCKKQVVKAGRQDLVDDYERKQRDPKKKTIVLYNDAVPFAGDEIARRGVGGSEGDIIHLAKEFMATDKFNVRVYCKCLREGFYDNVMYRDNKKMEKDLSEIETDVFISSRNLQPFFDAEFKKKYKVKEAVYWAHDLAEDPMCLSLNDTIANIDKVVVLSEFHKQNLMAAYKIPEEKVIIIPNGIDPARYLKRESTPIKKGKCIYSSTPYRGLDVLLRMWPRIKKEVPHAQLSIFSSIRVYGEFFDDSPWEDLYALSKRLDGVNYHGTVKHDRLAKEQMESELCLYPNHFPETCCVTAMECQTAGTPMITSNKGALPGTLKKGCGVLLDGEPHTQEYQDAFVKATVDLLINEDKLKVMGGECIKHNFAWGMITKEWIKHFCGEEGTVGEIKKYDWDTIYKKELDRNKFRIDDARFNYLKQFVKTNDKILDIGCGLGAFPRFIRKAFPESEIWGHEQSMFAQDYNRQSDKTIFFANHPIENPEYEADYFDLIFCQHVLQHIEKPADLLKIIERILKPQGKLVVVVPKDYKDKLIETVEPFNVHVEFHGVISTAEPDIIAVTTWKNQN